MDGRRNKTWYFLIAAIVGAYLLLFPEEARASVTAGLRLCADLLIPALLPYFVLSGLLIRSGLAAGASRRASVLTEKLFHLPADVTLPWALGLLGGYPLGAKTAADLCRAGRLSPRDAQSCLAFSACCGPAFLVGAAGIMLGWPPAGLALYGIHVTAAILTGVLLRPPKRSRIRGTPPLPETPVPPFSQALASSLGDAAASLLTVCASVAGFTVLGGIARIVFRRWEILRLAGAMLLELTAGCAAVSESAVSWQGKFILISAAAAWGGLSVAVQTAAGFHGTDLRLAPYLRAKALHAVIAAVLSVPVSLLLRPAVAAMASAPAVVPVSPWPWCLVSVAMVFLIFLQIPSGNSENHGV